MKMLKLVAFVIALSLSSICFAQTVNINEADAKTLAANVNGIGMSKAKAIVAYRDQYGPFDSVKDLVNVKGVGNKTVEKNKDRLIVGDSMR
jgi:competence protein ComEA